MLIPVAGTSRIVRDIEVRYTASGTAVSSTALVNSRKWKDKSSGELVEDTCFIDVVAFGKTAEFLNQYFRKGDVLAFNGYLQQDKWEDQNGAKRSKHTIRMESVDFPLVSKGDGGSHIPKEPGERGAPAGGQYQVPSPQTPPEIDIDEDEIPF